MAMKQGAIGTRDPEKAWGNCGNLSMKRWIFFFHFEQYLVFSVVSHREFISIISFTNLIPVTVKLNLFERRMQYWILNVWTTRALKDSKGHRLIKRLMFDWESYQDLSSCLESLRQPEDLKLAILSVVPSRPQGLNSQVWYTPTHRVGIFLVSVILKIYCYSTCRYLSILRSWKNGVHSVASGPSNPMRRLWYSNCPKLCQSMCCMFEKYSRYHGGNS